MYQMEYKKIFIKKELWALMGNNKKNLIVASLLLTITVFTVSLSLGAFEELKKRMDNPYTNWVTMPVLRQYEDSLPRLRYYFNKSENLKTYNLKNVSGYVKWSGKFLDPKTLKVKEFIGRSLQFDDDMAAKIFENSNVIALKNNFSPEGDSIKFEIFISEEFCNIMQIDKNKSVGKDIILRDFNDGYIFLFKIGGILKTLPNHSQFVVSQDFYNMFKENYATTGFVSTENQTKINIISSGEIDRENIKKLIEPIEIIDIEVNKKQVAGGTELLSYTIYTSDFISDSTASLLTSKLNNKKNVMKLHRVWNPVAGFSELTEPMYVSFNFMELDKIRELQSFLKEKFDMEIELSVVEDRDNFSMVSKLTYFMISSLIIISLISFSIFLFNLISSHLDKIKANIGTFMAFGFNTKVIREIYSKTVMTFMGYAWIASSCVLLLFWAFGYLTNLFSLSVFHPIVISTFVLFNAIAWAITYYITRKLLKETPGDLIYNRV